VGAVTLRHTSGSIFLQDATGALYAEASSNTLVHLGDVVEVVGQVNLAGYSPTLRDALYRPTGRREVVRPKPVTGLQLESGALDMYLVQLSGELIARPLYQQDVQTLDLSSDHVLVLLQLQANGSPLSQLQPGSRLRATGICSVGGDKNHHPTSFRIHLRSGDDVTVLRGPPWWTAQRTAVVLGIAAALALATVAWMASARHKQLSLALEKRVQERTAELESANRELESFSYSVSHDLRAPLRAIAGFSEALVEDYSASLDPGAKAYLQRIRDAAGQMNRLIEGLLKLARLTRSELHREPTDLSAVAAAVVDELRHTEPSRDVQCTIQPGMVDSVDRNLIRIVFANLLQNAWKFTAKTSQPQVQVGQLNPRNHPVYFVRDNGAGFEPCQAEKLFQVFQRLHSAAEYEGTGIGLATVHRIVQRHGGRVWAEGKVKEGACFYFTLAPER
jgi:signal transduction histidine kinase